MAKKPADLTHAELQDIVTRIRNVLYPDGNPDSEWSSDEIRDVAAVLDLYGFRPGISTDED